MQIELLSQQLLFSGGARNHPVVQSVINQANIDGATLPNSTTIAGLNAFFTAIESVMSKAEMIKIGYLCDGNCLEFSRYNFVNPALYKSTFPAGTIIYGTKGWSSNGTSYINDGITMKRRAGINTDSSSIAVTDAYNNASVDQAACGSVSGNYYILRPYQSGGGIYYWTSTTPIAPSATSLSGFTSLSTNGLSGARARLKQGSTYTNFSTGLTGGEMTNDLPVFTCAYNNAGTPLRWFTQGNVQFRWEGYELTDAELELIQTAWNAYVTAITPTFSAGVDITSDGREVWLVGGDSKTGTSSAVGRYALPNTVFQRRRSNGLIEEVKGADLFDIPSTGSFCPYFGRLYNEASASRGKKPVFAFYGIGGSAFINTFKPASWDRDYTGQLYPLAKAVWDAALVTVGVTKPKGIIIILGINDMNQAGSLPIVEAEIDTFFSRLNTDYGSPKIYISLPALQTPPTGTALTRLTTIRAKLNSIVSLNSNIKIFEDEFTQVFNNPANTSDGSHFNYAGNEVVAQNLLTNL